MHSSRQAHVHSSRQAHPFSGSSRQIPSGTSWQPLTAPRRSAATRPRLAHHTGRPSPSSNSIPWLSGAAGHKSDDGARRCAAAVVAAGGCSARGAQPGRHQHRAPGAKSKGRTTLMGLERRSEHGALLRAAQDSAGPAIWHAAPLTRPSSTRRPRPSPAPRPPNPAAPSPPCL